MKIFAVVFLLCAMIMAPARAGRIDEPFSLGKLDMQSSLIVKVMALESEPVRDNLTAVPLKASGAPYALNQTRFKIISVLKGKMQPGDEINFRHYTFALPFQGAWTYSVRNYNFAPGHSYLLWANHDGDSWKPFSPYDTALFSEQGALLAADAAPVEGKIQDVVWNQIQALLTSSKTGEVNTGLRYLGRMRLRDAGTRETTGDFTNNQVAEALRPFINASDVDTAIFAMRVAKFDALRFESELLNASNSPEPRVRAAAIDALSFVKTPASQTRIRAAVSDSAPDVAATALRSLGAFPDDATRATWKRWANSDEPARRIGVAQGIARAHDKAMLTTLQTLTRDADKKVSDAAHTAFWMYGDTTTRLLESF